MSYRRTLRKNKGKLTKSLFELSNSSQPKIANKVDVNSVKPTLAYYLNLLSY